MKPAETAVEDEGEVVRRVRETKSELTKLIEDKASKTSQCFGDLKSQLTKFKEKQKAATTQLQQQMLRIEQLCTKLSSDVNTLATKARR